MEKRSPLVGSGGTIWFYNHEKCVAITIDPITGAERQEIFPVKDLYDWIKKLDITSTADNSIRSSNWFEED